MLPLTRRWTLSLALASLLPAPRLVFAADRPKVSVALDWTPNTNHVGLYVAKAKGFYEEAGINVEIMPYTDTSAGTLVANGVADFGIAGPISLFAQRAAGAPLKGVYAVVQTETGRLILNDSRKDIQRPKDLDGKTYGGFGSAWEEALVSAMIRADGGEGKFNTITLGTSAYEALADGSVDFTLEVYTWEGIAAELEKRALRRFRYADYGVPDEQTTLIVSNDAFVANNAAKASAFIKATRRGYDDAVNHPQEATRLLIEGSGGALTNIELVAASMKALIDGNYLRAADGTVGTIDPAKMAAICDFLFDNGILCDAQGAALKDKPDIPSFYTNALFD